MGLSIIKLDGYLEIQTHWIALCKLQKKYHVLISYSSNLFLKKYILAILQCRVQYVNIF